MYLNKNGYISMVMLNRKSQYNILLPIQGIQFQYAETFEADTKPRSNMTLYYNYSRVMLCFN